MHKKLRGDTAEPTWPKGYPTPWDIIVIIIPSFSVLLNGLYLNPQVFSFVFFST